MEMIHLIIWLIGLIFTCVIIGQIKTKSVEEKVETADLIDELYDLVDHPDNEDRITEVIKELRYRTLMAKIEKGE